MPPKKAAKKVAKKSAKKTAKHGDARHGESKDLRRAYEHLGRLTVLEPRLAELAAAQVRALTELARNAIVAREPKSAADLLRAGEHLAFASLVTTTGESHVSEPLQEAIRAEYDHLLQKAIEHGEEHKKKRPKQLAAFYKDALDRAEAAAKAEEFRPALEYVRAAEALAHVHGAGQWMLPEQPGKKKLKS